MKSDNRLARLIEARDRVSGLLAVCENGRDAAPLSRELRLLLREIEEIQPGQEAVKRGVDQITERRAARRAAGTEAEGRASGDS